MMTAGVYSKAPARLVCLHAIELLQHFFCLMSDHAQCCAVWLHLYMSACGMFSKQAVCEVGVHLPLAAD